MKLLQKISISLSLVFVAACATQTPNQFPNTDTDYISVEVTVEDDDLSFWDVPLLEDPLIDTKPKDRNDDLIVGELGVDGGNKQMIAALAQEIADGAHGDYDSLLIAHKGKLLFESYYRGGRINLTHPQVSATKAYTSLALGRAIQLGYLSMSDLDKPLVSFFPDLDAAQFVNGADRITLHQALMMSSGLRIAEEQEEALAQDPSSQEGQRQVQAFLENSAPITAESQRFLYQGTDPNLVMQVIDAVVPGTAEAFIRAELFNKVGITTYNWQKDVSGLPAAGSRASITSRAMARLGTLVLNHGQWKGEQLIPRAYINKSISRLARPGEEDTFGGGDTVSNYGYGYFWWQADLRVGDKDYFSTSAQGGGGQFILLIAELDLMIVATAHEPDVTTLQMTAERILPAFIN